MTVSHANDKLATRIKKLLFSFSSIDQIREPNQTKKEAKRKYDEKRADTTQRLASKYENIINQVNQHSKLK